MTRTAAVSLLVLLTAISVPAHCQAVPNQNVTTIQVPVVQPVSGAAQQGPGIQPLPPLQQGVTIPPGQEGSEWDRARAMANDLQRGPMAPAIDRWRMLSSSDRFGFSDYANFIQTYPAFPDEPKLRLWAERALDRETVDSSRLVAFFDRRPPLSNPARALYALALSAQRRPDATGVALNAWRGGPMSDAAEATLFSMFAGAILPADHDARMNALLWAGALAQAQRQILYVTPQARAGFLARLAALQGTDPESLGLALGGDVLRDPGYVFNRLRQLRRAGQTTAAIDLLSNRQPFATQPLNPERWVDELLAVAKAADASSAVRIASSVDDAFPPGTDISRLSFDLRDDYTSLTWLGATKALNALGDSTRAASLFYRYGAAARTPQTRSKGFYWAGRALSRAGNSAGATRYFEMAAAYPDQFYGMLALERLGRPLPSLITPPMVTPTVAERAAFANRPLTMAVREVARDADWPTAVRFFREITEQAVSQHEHIMVAELARDIGRRDLAVILGQGAHVDGYGVFRQLSFPLIPIPANASWTMDHAITRQESQFAQNAVSHAGARGLMQLMPGTAADQARKLGLAYQSSYLTADAGYNLHLGDSFFAHLMDIYGGSYPLAVAAYNAGPGNVNKWLRSNGDPRHGGIEWIDWIEQIPLSETRGYVQHVIENAVVYEAMNPARATYRGPNPLSHFLGKRSPG